MLPEKIIAQVSTCQDLVQCAFSLNDFEVEVYNQLTEAGPLRADELADQDGQGPLHGLSGPAEADDLRHGATGRPRASSGAGTITSTGRSARTS